jgi:hypothetical protein
VTDPDLDYLFSALSDRAGLPRPEEAEIAAALDLARVVARGIVRKGAPLTCYAAGLAMGAAADPTERAARLRELVGLAEELAEELDGGDGGEDGGGHGTDGGADQVADGGADQVADRGADQVADGGADG